MRNIFTITQIWYLSNNLMNILTVQQYSFLFFAVKNYNVNREIYPKENI